MSQVAAVLFDYGLVLSGPPDPGAWDAIKTILLTDEESLQQAYWAPRHDYDRGTLPGQTYWRLVADQLGATVDQKQVDALIRADTRLWTQPNQSMIDWAASLQRRGVKTGILSNIGDEMEAGVRGCCAWLADFDHHTFSHQLGIAKPEVAIYLHAAEGLKTAPVNVLFIDDREENIAAAEAAGMQAIRYRDHAGFLREMQERDYDFLLDL